MAIPNDLRQMNRRQVLLASLRSGPTTRSALSRATGISPPTTGKIVDELIDDRVLRAAAGPVTPVQGPGRPGYLLVVDDVLPRFLAVQVGAVHTRLATLAVAPVLRDVWSKVIPTPASRAQWVASTAAAARTLVRQPPMALLVSLPGVLDETTGRTLLSPNLPWMEGEAIAAALGEALDLPAYPVQEMHCLAMGHRAADPKADNFLLVDFGIGIGSAAILNGGLARGPLPFAGEIGHTPVPGNSALCRCGGVGCLETLVGRRRLFGDGGAGLAGTDGDDALAPTDADGLIASGAASRLRSALQTAGLSIASSMNTLGLDHAVITGFAADLPPDLFAILRESISGAAIAARFGVVRTEAAPRHRLAGLASVGIDRCIAPA